MGFQPSPFLGEENTSKAAIEKNAGIYQGKQKKGGSRAGRQYKRKAKGQHGGGQFAAGGGGGSTAAQRKAAAAQKKAAAAQLRKQQTISLQQNLNSMGANLKVDGVYGPKTAAAVAALQKKYGLPSMATSPKSAQAYLKRLANQQAAAKQKAATQKAAAQQRGRAIRQRGQAAASQRLQRATAGKPAVGSAASSSSAGGKSAAAVQARLAQQLKR